MGSFYHHGGRKGTLLPESSHSPIESIVLHTLWPPPPNFTGPHPTDPLGTGSLFQSLQLTGWLVESSIAYWGSDPSLEKSCNCWRCITMDRSR